MARLLAGYVPYPAYQLIKDPDVRREILKLVSGGGGGSVTSVNGQTGIVTITAASLGAVGGTGVAGQVSYWSGVSTQTGNASFTWDNTNKYLSINDTVPTAYLTVKNLTGNDVGTLGTTLVDATGWIQTGWTGDFTTGFIHTPGNVNALTRSFGSINNSLYQVVFNVTGFAAGESISVRLGAGAIQTFAANTTVTLYFKSVGTNQALTFTPTITAAITVKNITVKLVTGARAILQIKDSTSSKRIDIKSPTGDNLAIGQDALANSTTSSFNIALGLTSLQYHTSGSRNIAIGTSALRDNPSGSDNVAIGYLALAQSQTTVSGGGGTHNIAIGSTALGNTANTGLSNIGIGSNAGANCTSGAQNIIIGHNAMSQLSTALQNVAIGYQALTSLTTGSNNTSIGYNAGAFFGVATANATPTSCIYIGSTTKASAAAQTNEIVIGALAVGRGSNTIIFGAGITDNFFSGKIVMGTAVVDPTYSSGAIIFRTDINKPRIGINSIWQTILTSGEALVLDSKHVVTSGSAVVMNNNTRSLYIDLPSLLATYTITLPQNPLDGQEVHISFGGTITSGPVVTSLTIQGYPGTSILTDTPVTTANAGQSNSYKYEASGLRWRKM